MKVMLQLACDLATDEIVVGAPEGQPPLGKALILGILEMAKAKIAAKPAKEKSDIVAAKIEVSDAVLSHRRFINGHG